MTQASELAKRCPECGHMPTMSQCVVILRDTDDRCKCSDDWHKENKL